MVAFLPSSTPLPPLRAQLLLFLSSLMSLQPHWRFYCSLNSYFLSQGLSFFFFSLVWNVFLSLNSFRASFCSSYKSLLSNAFSLGVHPFKKLPVASTTFILTAILLFLTFFHSAFLVYLLFTVESGSPMRVWMELCFFCSLMHLKYLEQGLEHNRCF